MHVDLQKQLPTSSPDQYVPYGFIKELNGIL